MRIVLICLLTFAVCCGASPSGEDDVIVIGPTQIVVHKGARNYSDLPVVIDGLQHMGAMWHDEQTAIDIYSVTVEFVPCSETFSWFGKDLGPKVVGLYDPHGRVLVRTCTEDLYETALFHELFQHRYPHVLFNTPNAQHAQSWVGFEDAMRGRLRNWFLTGRP